MTNHRSLPCQTLANGVGGAIEGDNVIADAHGVHRLQPNTVGGSYQPRRDGVRQFRGLGGLVAHADAPVGDRGDRGRQPRGVRVDVHGLAEMPSGRMCGCGVGSCLLMLAPLWTERFPGVAVWPCPGGAVRGVLGRATASGAESAGAADGAALCESCRR